MDLPFPRRTALIGLSSAVLVGLSPRSRAAEDVAARLSGIERDVGGRIGAALLASGGTVSRSYRGHDAFPLCSTFKVLAASLVLKRVERGEEQLERRIVFGREALVVNSPVTETRTGGDGMSLAEICQAAITRSDNTAGNLLLASFGGPAALTAFARSLGDEATRLDRTEPTLNEGLPGDPRDTTHPAAMAENLAKLAIGDALQPRSRAQLREWLIANQTGAARIRAGAPSGWRIGDKTGTGERGAASDIAVLWPAPEGTPVVLCIYLAGSTRPIADLNGAIAEVARIMIGAIPA